MDKKKLKEVNECLAAIETLNRIMSNNVIRVKFEFKTGYETTLVKKDIIKDLLSIIHSALEAHEIEFKYM